MPAPPPEPVAAFVTASTTLAPVLSRQVPRFAAALESTPILKSARLAPATCERWMSGAPQAEPVAAFVTASATLAPVLSQQIPCFTAARESTPTLSLGRLAPVACERWMSGPAPEPVAALVQAAAALVPAHRLELPRFTAELELISSPDLALATPSVCERWMSAPAAEPVCSFLRASIAPAVAVPPALHTPAFNLCAAHSQEPWIAQAQPATHSGAVMTAARPTAASAPLEPVRQAKAMALPAMPQVARQAFGAAKPTTSPAPEAVERWLTATRAAAPVSMEHALRDSLESGELPTILESVPAMCRPVASPAPDALESWLAPSLGAFLTPASALRMLPFKLAASQERTLPNSNARVLAPAFSMPHPAAPRLVAPQPIATVGVTPPAAARRRLESALPHPGLLPIEFHSHRLRSAAAACPDWKMPRLALLPPRFLLSPILEKLEHPAPQQMAARRKPDVVTLPITPAGKRPPAVWMVAGRIAAGFMLVASLWYGVASFRTDRRVTARQEVSTPDTTLSADNAAGSVEAPKGTPGAQPAPKGPVAWVRQTIADRASIKIAENFRGLENWDGAAKTRPAGWSRNREGYVNTGALAFFRPSLKFTDYHMEFLGQIETKSIGWTVRTTDASNYHAMKVTVVEAGIRPFVALVHYDVVGGKSGHRTQTPLNIMVHNNTPLQFAVDVRGKRVVTSINGEEVDSFVDNTLLAGGVGFFSEAGERARLYWMRVSRNDDWLGHVCAMLAEETGVGIKAGMRGPDPSGGAPAPGLPADSDGRTLAAVWIALPYLGVTRKTRFLKTWRSEPWNT